MSELREAAKMALEALKDMAEYSPSRLKLQIEVLRQALAQPEQSSIPDFPAPFTKADLDIYAPDSWDDERKQTWIDLQVCQRNKIQLHKYAKQLRELLLAQPEQEPVEPPSNKYNSKRIAWELERTAMGDGYYGNALYVAMDMPQTTRADREMLNRYMHGSNLKTDHVKLQDLAMRIYTALEQPEQEPVAWLYDWKDGVEIIKDWITSDFETTKFNCAHNIRPLYATPISEPVKERISEPVENLEPVAWDGWILREVYFEDGSPCGHREPPKREWVGLTDEERVQAFVDAGLELAYMDYDADMRISSVIEAKLKEKNFDPR